MAELTQPTPLSMSLCSVLGRRCHPSGDIQLIRCLIASIFGLGAGAWTVTVRAGDGGETRLQRSTKVRKGS